MELAYPILYDPSGAKIAELSDCSKCTASEDRNGGYEARMDYPMIGTHFADIKNDCILQVYSAPGDAPQKFRVYHTSKPISGIVSFSAHHIVYDQSGLPCKPFTATSATAAMAGLKSHSVLPCPFNFSTDVQSSKSVSFLAPQSIRACLGSGLGSILETYGGELHYDNYTTHLEAQRGRNRGMVIEYGQNMLSLTQDENCAKVYTGIYPYWRGQKATTDPNAEAQEIIVTLPEGVVKAPGTYPRDNIEVVDLSSSIEGQPSVEQLRQKAKEYIAKHQIGIPEVSLTVSYAQIKSAAGHEQDNVVDDLRLCDTATIKFPALGVSASAKAVHLDYDCIRRRVISARFGTPRRSITDTIDKGSVALQVEVRKKAEAAREEARKAQEAAEKKAQELAEQARKDAEKAAAADATTKADNALSEAKKHTDALDASLTPLDVFNRLTDHGRKQGIYRGKDNDLYINANFVKVGTLMADLIQAGVLQSKDGSFYLDLVKGLLKIKAIELTVGGKTVNSIAGTVTDSKINAYDKTLTPLEIYNKLTDYGRKQGLYRGDDSNLYINASYINVGTLVADLIQAGVLQSKDGSFYLDLVKGLLKIKAIELTVGGKTVNEISKAEAGGVADSKITSYNQSLTNIEIWKKLTDNGRIKGLTQDPKTGDLYFSCDFLKSDTIISDQVHLRGKFTVYKPGTKTAGGYLGYLSGMTGNGVSTDGIGIMSPDGKNYVVATTAGVALKQGATTVYIADGKVHVDGPLYVHGPIYENAKSV